jgi:hypothetical protein
MDFVTVKPIKGYSLTEMSVEMGIMSLKDVFAVYTLREEATEVMFTSAVLYKLDTHATEVMMSQDTLYALASCATEVMFLPPPIYYILDTESTEVMFASDLLYKIDTESTELVYHHPEDIPTPMVIQDLGVELGVEVKSPKMSVDEMTVTVAVDGSGDSATGDEYSLANLTTEVGLAVPSQVVVGEMRTEIGIYMHTLDTGNGFEAMGVEVGLY